MFLWTIRTHESDSFWQKNSRITLANPCPFELARIRIREAAAYLATTLEPRSNFDLVSASLDQSLSELCSASVAAEHSESWLEGILGAVDYLRHAITTMQEVPLPPKSFGGCLAATARALAALFPMIEKIERRTLDKRDRPMLSGTARSLRAMDEWSIDVVFD